MRKKIIKKKHRQHLDFLQTVFSQLVFDLKVLLSQLVFDLKTFPVANVVFLVCLVSVLTFLFETIGPRSFAMVSPPSVAPSATSYSLSAIFDRLTTNSSTTAGDHDFAPAGPPDASMHTLSDIYSAIPTIDATKVASGTSYLGISGSLLPSGGTATSGAVLAGLLFYGENQTDWSLQTGTMPNIGQQIFMPANANQPISMGYHNGTGYVVGDPDLIASNISYGVELFGVVGSMAANPLYGDINDPTKVLTTASNSGSYDASNLLPENVRNGITYGAGESGTFSGELAFGDDDASRVLTSAATAGTFDVSRLSDDLIAYGTRWGVHLDSVGSMLGDTNSSQVLTTAAHPGTFDISNLNNNAIASGVAWGDRAGSVGAMFGDTSSSLVLTTASHAGTYNAANLSAGTVKTGVSYGSGLTGSYPSTNFPLSGSTPVADLAGNGLKITTTNSSVEWWKSDGTRQSATLDFPDADKVCSNTTVNTIPGTLIVSAGNIAGGSTFCGISGTLLTNLFNGTRTTNASTWPGGVQNVGGVEDFNANGSNIGTSPPSDRYSKTWTACNVNNSYCGTNDTGSAYKDDSTGLIWSKTLNSTTYSLDDSNGTMSWLIANNCNEVSGSSCTKKSSSKTGCEANPGWFLPHQRQLMQAYIDGSYGNMEPTGLSSGTARSYWSSTTLSSNLPNGFSVNLSTGSTGGSAKTGGVYVRCVR